MRFGRICERERCGVYLGLDELELHLLMLQVARLDADLDNDAIEKPQLHAAHGLTRLLIFSNINLN